MSRKTTKMAQNPLTRCFFKARTSVMTTSSPLKRQRLPCIGKERSPVSPPHNDTLLNGDFNIRPPCIGQEHSPLNLIQRPNLIHNSSHCSGLNTNRTVITGNLLRSHLYTDWDNSDLDVTSSTVVEDNVPQAAIKNNLLRSHLYTDWDNSDLDVTSSTIVDTDKHNSSQDIRRLIFLTHIKECVECCVEDNRLCDIGHELEDEVSSFFEIEDNQLVNIGHQELSLHNGEQSSYLTATHTQSDSDISMKEVVHSQNTDFVYHMDRNTKRVLSKRMKLFRRNRSTGQFRTLAIV